MKHTILSMYPQGLNTTYLPLSLFQPPIAMSTTDPPDFWTVMFSLREGGSDREVTTIDNRVMFENLLKGTEYRARVAGTNVRGIGTYSPYVNNQTNVDRKQGCRQGGALGDLSPPDFSEDEIN